mmetsp:Transcript_19267/g.59450  ORF Transcript_19267/g.59450 Transcript_19267/m.59450 type:complete len:375 (+) Transcript_19267:1305-2429(+)
MKLNLSHKYHRLLEGGKMCGAGLSLGVAFFLRVRWSHAEDFRKGGRAPAAAVGGVAWTTTRRDVLFDVVGGQRRCGVEEAGLLVVAGGEEEVVSGVEDAEVEGEDGVGVAGEVVKESAGARVEVSEAGRVGEGDDEAEVVPLEVDDGAGVDGGEADDGFGVVEDRDGAGVVAGGEPRRGTAERNRSGDAVRGQGQLRDDFLRFQMEHRHGRAVQGGRDDVRAVRVTRKSLLRQVDDGPVVAGELRVDVPAGALFGGPVAHGAVGAAGKYGIAVAREEAATHRSVVARENTKALPRPRLPQPHRAVLAARRQHVAARVELEPLHVPRTFQRLDERRVVRGPHSHAAVVAAGSAQRRVPRKPHARHAVCVAAQTRR